jgi:DNA-binding MarR family transcriptional regulator
MGRVQKLSASAEWPDASSAAMPWPSCVLSSTRRTARLLTQLYDSYLSEHGIEAAQFALMMMVEASADKGQAAMGRALGMDKTTLSRNLKVLRAKGWVESVKGEDARQRSIALTKEGRDVLSAARPAWKRAQAEVHAGMSEKEWSGMWASLQAVTRSATAAAEKVRAAK